MAYETNMSAAQAERLAEIGRLLMSTRDLYFEIWDAGLRTPRPGSLAERDWASVQLCHGSEEPWPEGMLRDPSSLAVNWTQQAVNNLVGLGILFKEAEFMESPVTLARAAVEFMTRSAWVLDPKVGHRIRCARQWLTELKTYDAKVTAIKYRVPDWESSDLSRETKAKRRAMKDQLGTWFALEEPKGGTTLDGEKYLNFTEVAAHWATAAGVKINGGAIYEYLALQAHPQGLSAGIGQLKDRGDGTAARAFKFDEFEKLGQLVAIMFYTVILNVVDYHGHDSAPVNRWADRVNVVFPGAISDEHPAG